MPRPKRIRRMINPPLFKGFKPIGITDTKQKPVVLNYEEYEAIRLSDFDLHGQVEAAIEMGVSRPTFARIYESARRKVAQAFVQGSPIVFEGGKVYFDSEWYSCNLCGSWFNHIERETEIRQCPLCGSDKIEPYSDELHEDMCVCTGCGYETEHQPGAPCNQNICPKCNSHMMRRGAPHYKRMHNQKKC